MTCDTGTYHALYHAADAQVSGLSRRKLRERLALEESDGAGRVRGARKLVSSREVIQMREVGISST